MQRNRENNFLRSDKQVTKDFTCVKQKKLREIRISQSWKGLLNSLSFTTVSTWRPFSSRVHYKTSRLILGWPNIICEGTCRTFNGKKLDATIISRIILAKFVCYFLLCRKLSAIFRTVYIVCRHAFNLFCKFGHLWGFPYTGNTASPNFISWQISCSNRRKVFSVGLNH